MTTDDLEQLLEEWGALSKYEESRGEGSTDFHVLQRARDFAPGTRARAAVRLVGRDGAERRRLMAAGLSACGVRIVPMDYVDPVAGTPTRKAGPRSRAESMIPERLRAIHDAALELYRVDTLGGLVLRQEYCGYGSQHTKAERVSVAMGSPVGIRIYRESLARAKGWMHARMTQGGLRREAASA